MTDATAAALARRGVLNYLASRLPYRTVSRRQLVRRAVRVLTRLERLGYVAQQPV